MIKLADLHKLNQYLNKAFDSVKIEESEWQVVACQNNDQINLKTQIVDNENVLEIELENVYAEYSQKAFLTPDQTDRLIQKLLDIRRQWPSSEVK